MGAGNPVGSAGLRFKLSGQDELKREARKLAAELQSIMASAGVGQFGYAGRLLSGRPVTTAQRRAGFAEMDYVRQATDAQFRERLHGVTSADEARQVREAWQQTRSTISSSRAMGALAPPASTGSGMGPFHPARLALGFARGLIGLGAIGAPTYYLAQSLRRMAVAEQSREADIGDTMNRLAPPGGLSGLYGLTMSGGLRARMNPAEFTRFLGGMGAAAGAVATPLASQAAQLSRVFGIAPGRGANIFGGEARLGIDSLEGQKRFAGYIAEAVQHGRMRGREGEVFESIQKATEGLADFFGTTGAQNASMQGAMATTLGILANPKIPGLEGAAGMAAMIRANSAIAGASVLNMPDILTPIAGIMMQRHGGTIAEKMRFQQEMLIGPDTTSQAGRQNLIEMFKLANEYMPGGTGPFQLAMQLGSPIYMEMAKAFMSPGKGMTPEQAMAKAQAEGNKLTPAQAVEQKLAEWKEKEAEAGAKLVPAMLDFTNLMVKLSPYMIKLADYLAKYFDDVNKRGLAPATATAVENVTTKSATGLFDFAKNFASRAIVLQEAELLSFGGGKVTPTSIAQYMENVEGLSKEHVMDLLADANVFTPEQLKAASDALPETAIALPPAMRGAAAAAAKPKLPSSKTDHPSTPSAATEAGSIPDSGASRAKTVIIHTDHTIVHGRDSATHGTTTGRTLMGPPMHS